MKDTILVTGATGNVGSQVAQQLIEAGIKPRVAVRSLSKAGKLQEAGAIPVEMDLNKPETVEAGFAGVDKVFWTTLLVPNLVEVDAITLEAAKKAGVKHIVKLSVMGADTHPEMLLAQLHCEAEKMVEDSGISYTFLRPNSFYQNYITYNSSTIKEQNTFYLPHGDGKISLVDTRDIAAVAVAALTQSGHENKAYQITGAEALSNHQVAEILSTVLGRSIHYVDISEDAARAGMNQAGMPDVLIDMVLGLYAAQKAGDYSLISPVVEHLTGKKPISFEKFAYDYAAAFK